MGEFAWWGHKTIAFFDVWSIEHFIVGLSLFGVARWLSRKAHGGLPLPQFRHYIAYLLMIAFGWEACEFYLETGSSGIDAVTYWFQGVEFWGNRLIADPLLVLLGGYVAFRRPRFVFSARLLSASWLIAHIFIFPHSMHLQALF